jgi:hypothetical protein
MSKIEEKTSKSDTFTCPNTFCGKSFTKPLKTLNLQQNPREPYDACPYCLTEVSINNEPITDYSSPEAIKETEESEAKVKAGSRLQAPAVTGTPSGCLHYIGYLSEKSLKEQIPDECMMCKDIVSCMLKKMQG